MADREETWLGLERRVKPLVRAGIVLGIGLGGFFDGIVLHQVLQWHHMLSAHSDSSVAGDLELNVLADGLFHVSTYAFTILGVVLLVDAWRHPEVPPSGRTLFGSALMGWGVFNLLEGLVNHQLLGIHHVWPGGPGPVIVWDAAFLLSGVVFLAGGYAVVRGDEAAAPGPRNEPARDDRVV